jgi:gamma-glutamyltranspeptidase
LEDELGSDLLPNAPFVARRCAVAAPHQLGAAAGLHVLARGGNAIDAMVAVNAALSVVYPHMTGPGGDAFWLIFDAASKSSYVLNASGRAAARATLEAYSEDGAERIQPRGPRAALTVPGAVDGWFQAHSRFGRLSFNECLASSIDYAEEGFPVSPNLARWLAASADLLGSWRATKEIFLKRDGSPYVVGETLRNPALATTLRMVAADGRDAFYTGPIARTIEAALGEHRGVLTVEDFARHRSDWVAPVSLPYRGRTILSTPPNSQGFAALEILGMLESFDVAALADQPVDYIDLVVRATKLAFADRDRYLTDPDFGEIPIERLLSREYLDERASELRTPTIRGDYAARPIAGDTTFSCAVDSDGNAVGVIQSLYFEWGSGIVAGDTGFLLQNRGCFFSLDPSHPDRLEPGKRPFHTLVASMVLGAESLPELIFGTMGGEGQPQTQVALVTRVFDHGLDVQAAVDAPRWLYGRTWGDEHRGLRIESRFGANTVRDLAARGHENVGMTEPWSELMGHAQAIHVLSQRLEAAADPRGDGAALGW